jgi:hypothetical protein
MPDALKVGPMDCFETSVTNNQYTVRLDPEIAKTWTENNIVFAEFGCGDEKKKHFSVFKVIHVQMTN